MTAHPDHPTCLDDWIYTDKPPLSFKLVTFSNASLLTVSWSHTFLDAVGRQTLLKAWILVLNNREQDLPEFIGYKDDPEKTLGLAVPPEKHVLYPTLVPDSDLPIFINGMIQESLQHPVENARMIQIPDAFVQNLKRDAQAYLSRTTGQEPPFLSDADILFSWLIRLTYSCQSYPPEKLIALLNTFNYRGVASCLPLDKAYIGNAVTAAQTHLKVQDITSQHFAITASQIRKDLLQQKTPEQLDAAIALSRKLGHGPLFGNAEMGISGWSNWHRCRFYDFDFSAAVVDGTGSGKPTYINLTGHRGNFCVRNGGALLGKDKNDNWWISWVLRESAWEGFEKAFCEELKRASSGAN